MIELLLTAENALALGLLDQAEGTFRQVLDADPRNGMAAVGLSRVALERGDDAGALVLARAALEIDPENAAARRMADRLEEVARYRSAGAAGPAWPEGSPPADRPDAASGGPGAARDADPIPAGDADPAAPEPEITPAMPAPSGPVPARPGLVRRLLRRS